MKKLLILLFSLSFFGLEAQVKSSKSASSAQKMVVKKNTDGKVIPRYKRLQGRKAEQKEVKNPKKEIVPTFEGSIKLTNSDKKGLKGEFLVNGQKVAATIQGVAKTGNKYFIYNDEKTEVSLQTQQGSKLAFKQKRTPLILPKGASIGKKDRGTATIIKTGKTKTIGGFKCHEVTVKDNITDFQAWVSMEVPVSMKDILPSSVTVAHYLKAVTSEEGIMNAMIMEATQRDIASGKSFTLLAEVEPKKIKEKEFKIPNGYRLVDQSRASRTVRTITPASSAGSAQNKAKNALKKLEESQKAAAAEDAPAAPAAPVKE